MTQLTIRDATPADLPFIVDLIDKDAVSAARDPDRESASADQWAGFEAIAADPNHRLLVAEVGEEPVGSFQLSFIPGVSRQGTWRGQIESVRVAPERQGEGLGSVMMEWAIAQCRERGCGLVQLTSDTKRQDAHRFYERLGFAPSHTGFKLRLL
ncbi:MAG: GNAT family N-acetyltransferase [Pseudomonadota bacterium]